MSGNIAIMFGVASTLIVVAVGAGVDLSRAYSARQKLSEVATLTCQYSTRQSVVSLANNSGFSAYTAEVNSFAAKSLSQQNWNGATPTGALGGSYFTATPPVSPSYIPTNPVTDISASVPTMFMRIAHVTQIPVHAQLNCLNASATGPGNPKLPIHTTFDSTNGSDGPTGYYFTRPDGTTGTSSTPTIAFPANTSYTDPGGDQWYVLGYCLEIDHTGVINSTSPEGSHTAELDCDNGNGNAGNSSMSTKTYLATGYYELRYFFRSRIGYLDYYPAYTCGSTLSDVSWANSTNTYNFNPALRTNEINAYLDRNVNGTPPLHTTQDGSQQLAGSNLIDVCVDSSPWVERSVKIKITTADYYWLSFAADGANDSYGGQIDNIRLCQDTCAGTPQDNFPSIWLAANNGNVNKVLFEDTFETSPAYTQDSPPHYISKGHTLDASYGTSGSSSSSGWPLQSSTGWATGPLDQVTYGVQTGAAQGSQYIMLDGWNSNGDPRKNRLISRPFVLDPGYYQVSYSYLSIVNFNIPGLVFCQSAPNSGVIFTQPGTMNGTIRYYNSITTNGDTNVEGVFLSHGQLVSTPLLANAPWSNSANTTSSVTPLGSATSFNNPDGTVSATPTVPPDNVNYQNYNANVPNPLIDMCGYVDNWQWVPRTVSVKITKPGVYWLSFSANGSTADGNGAALDDVKLTALGSPYMNNPPTSALTAIPVPDPQPDTNYTGPANNTFNGFYTVADPFKPTAADQ